MNVKPPAARLLELKRQFETALAKDFDPGVSMAIDRVVALIEDRNERPRVAATTGARTITAKEKNAMAENHRSTNATPLTTYSCQVWDSFSGSGAVYGALRGHIHKQPKITRPTGAFDSAIVEFQSALTLDEIRARLAAREKDPIAKKCGHVLDLALARQTLRVVDDGEADNPTPYILRNADPSDVVDAAFIDVIATMRREGLHGADGSRQAARAFAREIAPERRAQVIAGVRERMDRGFDLDVLEDSHVASCHSVLLDALQAAERDAEAPA